MPVSMNASETQADGPSDLYSHTPPSSMIPAPLQSPDSGFSVPEQVNLPKLLDFLARRSGNSFKIEGISRESLTKLDDLALAGKIPGWDSAVRYAG